MACQTKTAVVVLLAVRSQWAFSSSLLDNLLFRTGYQGVSRVGASLQTFLFLSKRQEIIFSLNEQNRSFLPVIIKISILGHIIFLKVIHR